MRVTGRWAVQGVCFTRFGLRGFNEWTPGKRTSISRETHPCNVPASDFSSSSLAIAPMGSGCQLFDMQLRGNYSSGHLFCGFLTENRKEDPPVGGFPERDTAPIDEVFSRLVPLMVLVFTCRTSDWVVVITRSVCFLGRPWEALFGFKRKQKGQPRFRTTILEGPLNNGTPTSARRREANAMPSRWTLSKRTNKLLHEFASAGSTRRRQDLCVNPHVHAVDKSEDNGAFYLCFITTSGGGTV